MPQYRVYHLDGGGRVSSAEWLESPGDKAAISTARTLMDVQCELWKGRRLVTRLTQDSAAVASSIPTGENRSAVRR